MSEQRHIIKRQVIELAVPDGAQARRLHEEVSRIYRLRLVPLIDRHCSALAEPGRLYRIERLELDLGVIDVERLEAELVAGVSAALGPALEALLRGEPAGGRPGEDAGTASRLELLALFARTGSLPWWADAAAPGLLEEALRSLIERAPGPLRGLMRELAGERRALRRLAGQLPDAALAALAASLGAAPLAGQLPDAVLAAPAASLGAAPLAGEPGALVELVGRTRAAAGRTPAALRQIIWAAALEAAAAGGEGAAHPEAVLRRVAAALGTTYAALLAELHDAAQVSPAGAHVTLPALAETPALERPELEGRDAGPAAEASGERRPTSRQRPRPPVPTVSRAPDAAPPIDLSFSDADELYIGNAGLVILWPFLGSFFGRLGLLAGGRFRDSAAQHRAAGLLQRVAAGDEAWPEYLLPLNKLLCGLELDELFDFGPPLAEDEAAECEGLLAAAIAQAPILRDMSADGFRGSFLLRQGVLGARDGAWLLRVERQTYDIVLERFPWAWGWVRLPWMAAPLRVEW
jgi:hypothetical protein